MVYKSYALGTVDHIKAFNWNFQNHSLIHLPSYAQNCSDLVIPSALAYSPYNRLIYVPYDLIN